MSLHLTHLFRLVCNRVKMEKRKLSVEYMLMDTGKICSPLVGMGENDGDAAGHGQAESCKH